MKVVRGEGGAGQRPVGLTAPVAAVMDAAGVLGAVARGSQDGPVVAPLPHREDPYRLPVGGLGVEVLEMLVEPRQLEVHVRDLPVDAEV